MTFIDILIVSCLVYALFAIIKSTETFISNGKKDEKTYMINLSIITLSVMILLNANTIVDWLSPYIH